MEFTGIDKVTEGKFITLYNAKYKTESGNEKIYEMVSRDKNIQSLGDLKKDKCDAVILIIENEDRTKILLNKEFRMAVGNYAYNFPAGLIDPGEDCATAGRRELWEETGLELLTVDEIWPMSYSGVGITNERSMCLLGTARGEFSKSTSDEEEIEAGWYSKDELRELLKQGNFAARTQAFCQMWVRT